jgi:23S rRNA pseudouridine955/2504/2580 synthase
VSDLTLSPIGATRGCRGTSIQPPQVAIEVLQSSPARQNFLPLVVSEHNYKEMKDLSKDAVSHLAVDEAGAGQRVDNFLLRLLKGVPKSHIYRILRSGEVRVNRKRVRPDARLAAGDDLRIPPVRVAEPSARHPRSPAHPVAMPILYEDDALLAIDKPAGLAVHGGSGIAFGVIEQLRAARPQARFLELVHRLDRDTSGVLLVAKKRAALLALHASFREGKTDKRYLVLVQGRWREATRKVDLPLTKFVTGAGERRVRIERDGGKVARTVFHRRRVWADAQPPVTLLEAELHTGRTHQIRVHLTHLGFPLAGDDKYGDFAWNKVLARQGLKRMFLHAWHLSLPHPSDGQRLALESPLPADLEAFLAQLGPEGSDDGGR